MLFVLLFSSTLKAEEEEILLQSVTRSDQVLTKDLKTLEKAVYKKSDITSSISNQTDGLNEDILTKHLLKLNEIEDQFRELTNKFEEVNFKLDKLSSRVTKIQSDTQLRFSDLETSSGTEVKKLKQNYRVQVSPKTLEQIQVIQFRIYQKNKKLIQLSLHKQL